MNAERLREYEYWRSQTFGTKVGNFAQLPGAGRADEQRVTARYCAKRAEKRLRRSICKVLPVNSDRAEQDRILRYIRTGVR